MGGDKKEVKIVIEKENLKMTTKRSEKRVVRALNDKEIGFITAVLKKTPYLSDANIAQEIHNEGLAKDLNRKDLRNKVRYARRKITGEKPSERVRIQNLKDGSVVINAHETGMSDENSEKYLDEQLLADMGLNPEKFALSSYGESEWEVLKDGKPQVLHSRRKKFTKLTANDFDAAIMENGTYRKRLLEIYDGDVKTMNEDIQKFGSVQKLLENAYGAFYNGCEIKTNPDGMYSLVIPLADLHIGEGDAKKMVASYKATFVNYIFPYMQDMYFTNEGKVRSIDIACLGDLVHCDNAAGTTTAGTALQPHSSVYASCIECCKFLDWLIANLRMNFKVPIRFVYVYGNHDNTVGFGIVSTVKGYYRNTKGIEFLVNEKLFGADSEDEDNWYTDAELNPEYLWVKYGDVGITYTHGKFVKKNAKNIPEVANPSARKDVSYNAVIYGHLHHLCEGRVEVGQHNYGLSTPNFVRDKFGKSLGCVTDPEFYLFTVNHVTNRVAYEQFPSLPYNKQPKVVEKNGND